MIHGYLSDPEDFGQLPKAMEHYMMKYQCRSYQDMARMLIFMTLQWKTIELVKKKYMELASRCDQIDVFGMSMGGSTCYLGGR